MRLDDRFREFLQTCGQSDSSQQNYQRRLKAFLAEHGHKTAGEITAADINAWHSRLKQRGLAPATVAGYRQALKALFNYCVSKGDIPRSPAGHLKIGTFATNRQDMLPPEPDVQRVTDLAQTWLQSDTPHQLRDSLIWMLSYHSGPRLGEIMYLRAAAVDKALRSGPDTYGVYRMPSRGKTGRVVIRVAAHLVGAFQRWTELRPRTNAPEFFTTIHAVRPRKGGVVAVRGLTRSAADHIYVSICKSAGVKPYIRSHALRHRLGDLTTRQFGPKVAAILLNHRDWQQPATAIAFYHHPDEDDASRAIVSPHYAAAPDPGELDEMRRLFGV